MKKILSTSITMVFVFSTCYCQYLVTPEQNSSTHTIFLNAGLEPELTASVGYVHSVASVLKTIDLKMGGTLKVAPVILSNGAWRADFVTISDWMINDRWRNILACSIFIVHDHNRAGVMNGLGFELRSNPVLYGKRWVKGFDAGWQFTPFTHIRNSEETKKAFTDRYPDGNNEAAGPKDGWYRSAASRFRIGLTIARKINSSSMLQASLGSLWVVQKQGIWLAFSHAQIPAYVQLSYNYSW